MRLLLAHGADPRIFTAHNVTPLAVAAGIGWVEGVTYRMVGRGKPRSGQDVPDAGDRPERRGRRRPNRSAWSRPKGRPEVIQLLVDAGAKLDAHDGGSRDTVNGALVDETFIPLDWARGLVRVGVQSAIAHPEAEKLLVKLMGDRGIPVPPPPSRRSA